MWSLRIRFYAYIAERKKRAQPPWVMFERPHMIPHHEICHILLLLQGKAIGLPSLVKSLLGIK